MRRGRRRLLALAAVLAGWLPFTGGAAAHAAAIVPDGGVAVRGTTPEVIRAIDAAHEVGLRWISMSASWETLEPEPDGYLTPGGPGAAAWDELERQLTYARSRGMSVELRFANAPGWASGRPGVSDDPPTPANVAAFGDFLGDVGRRLGPSIDAYSPWNEPNLSNFWNPVDPVAYVRLQKAAYGALKEADPGATVLSAAIVGTYPSGYRFLTRAYEAGMAGSVDRIGWNAYPQGDPEERYSDENGLPSGASLAGQLYLRQLIDRYDPGRKVWLMEMSWSTCIACTGFPRNAVTDEQQADYLRRAYVYRRRHLAGVTERMFWYSMRDEGTDRSNWEHNQGLLRRDFSPKPAYAAMRSVAVEVPEAREGGAGRGDEGPGRGPGSATGAPSPAETLPRAAGVTGLPVVARRGRSRVAIGRIGIRPRRGRLLVTVRITVVDTRARVRVEGYRRGAWRPVAAFSLRRTSTARLRFVDRAYVGVRVRAGFAGRRGWQAARVARVPVRAER